MSKNSEFSFCCDRQEFESTFSNPTLLHFFNAYQLREMFIQNNNEVNIRKVEISA